jgi:hypothetical protein
MEIPIMAAGIPSEAGSPAEPVQAFCLGINRGYLEVSLTFSIYQCVTICPDEFLCKLERWDGVGVKSRRWNG